MKLDNDRLRHALAAEYVLGTLPPRARRRFQWHLRRDPALRRVVAQWERRLTPLAEPLPGVAPPGRVWRAIEQRVFGAPRPSIWRSLAFWRLAAAGAGVVAIAVAVWLAPPEDTVPPERMVTVMTDVQTQSPAMTVSWDAGRAGQRLLRIRVIGHAEMAPDTAWELWMLPGGDKPPVSLGLITTHETQTLTVPPELAAHLDQAWGLAMSVEPRGGSPTGLPTGPVLYKGQCVRT